LSAAQVRSWNLSCHSKTC